MEELLKEELNIDLYRLRIPLQFFADTDDKTEEPTAKRKSEARKKGQVAKSTELNSAIVLLAVFICLKVFGIGLYEKITELMNLTFNVYMVKDDLFTTTGIMALAKELIVLFFTAMLPIFAFAALMGVISNLMQSGLLFTVEPIKPKFSNINPIKGIKQMFSLKQIAEFFIKTILKVIIVGIIAYNTIKDNYMAILNTLNLNAGSIAQYIMGTIVDLGIQISAWLLVISIIDVVVQVRKHKKELRMTKQEIKEEFKQTEGNPQIKGKIKQKQRQMAVNRMMKQIPKADVVITNPTHFAVAIRYAPEENDAPTVIAKGQDYLALRIKEIAKENKVEIVENKALARTLYASVDIGEPIPEELYQAVAEILAYVYSIRTPSA